MHLLNTLLSKIQNEVVTNSTLDYIVHAEAVQALTSDIIVRMVHETPSCLIFPGTTTFTPISMAEAEEDHVYQINIAVLIDNYGDDNNAFIDTYDGFKSLPQIEADFRSVFNRNTFSISGLQEAYFQGATYSGITLDDRSIAQNIMRMLYEYTDCA